MYPSKGQQQRFISLALAYAHQSPFGNVRRHGAVAVAHGKVIGASYNTKNRTRLYGSPRPSLHAEMGSLRELLKHRPHKRQKKRSAIIIYNVRIDTEGRLKDARPCRACMRELIAMRIKAVIHSTANGDFEVVVPSRAALDDCYVTSAQMKLL